MVVCDLGGGTHGERRRERRKSDRKTRQERDVEGERERSREERVFMVISTDFSKVHSRLFSLVTSPALI